MPTANCMAFFYADAARGGKTFIVSCFFYSIDGVQKFFCT